MSVKASAFLSGYGGEGRYELSNPLAAAMRTNHVAPVTVGDVKLLREFLVAILAVKYVLRHGILRGDSSADGRAAATADGATAPSLRPAVVKPR